METNVFNIIVMILDGIAGFTGLLCLGNKHILSYIKNMIDYDIAFYTWLVGGVITSLGLIAQSHRNYLFYSTGKSLTDDESILWVMKDFGIEIQGLALIMYGIYVYRFSKKLRS